MRLLSVHRLHYRKGGAEAVHLDHLELFRERGWDCAEFAAAHQDNEPSKFSSYFPTPFDDSAEGVLGMARQIPRFIYNRRARDNFAKLLDDFAPDIIHCHGFYHHLTPAIIGPAVERSIPFVYTLHDFKLICPTYHFFTQRQGLCEKCRGGRQWNCLTNRCSNQSLAKDALYAAEGMLQWHFFDVIGHVSAFVGPSQFIVDKFKEHCAPKAGIHTIPNFFETNDDATASEMEVSQEKTRYGPYALYFGRMSDEKGIDRLIAAAARIGVRVVIAGAGPAEQKLRQEALSCGADVHFVGHQTGSRLWSLVEAATCVVLPSLWFENAPKSILEAQARGKVVICSDIGGLPELVDHGRTGFLVPADDVAQLGKTLSHVMTMELTQRAAIGDAARSNAKSCFTRERYFEAMSSLYRDLMQPAGGTCRR